MTVSVYVCVLVAQSCPTLCNPMDCSPPGSSVCGASQARILEWGCHFLLQGIFLTQGLDLGLLHCRQILYHLSHQGYMYILKIRLKLISFGSKRETSTLKEADHLCPWVCLFFKIVLTQPSPNCTLCQENTFDFFFHYKKIQEAGQDYGFDYVLTINFMLLGSYRQ